MTKEKAEQLEIEHNVTIDPVTEMFKVGGSIDDLYGWEAVPEEWK